MAEQEKGGGKKIAGQPVWVWAAAAGVVVLGYLYFKSHSAASSGKGGKGGGAVTTTRTYRTTGAPHRQFWAWHNDHHGPPAHQSRWWRVA